jgi:hypothetical protein
LWTARETAAAPSRWGQNLTPLSLVRDRYDETIRQMLVNETKRMDISSRNPAVVKNADGSTEVLHFTS